MAGIQKAATLPKIIDSSRTRGDGCLSLFYSDDLGTKGHQQWRRIHGSASQGDHGNGTRRSLRDGDRRHRESGDEALDRRGSARPTAPSGKNTRGSLRTRKKGTQIFTPIDTNSRDAIFLFKINCPPPSRGRLEGVTLIRMIIFSTMR